MSPKWWAAAPGHVLVVPNEHVENVYAMPDALLGAVYGTARRVAEALKDVHRCAGTSMRQHDEAGGGQDVWHFHVHVFPRHPDDGLYELNADTRWTTAEERAPLADRLRRVLAPAVADVPDPKAATRHLRRLARRIVDAALARAPVRAAVLVGSAGRGDADFYSDLDLILYVDELPPDHVLHDLRTAVGGERPIRRGRTDHFCGEEFELDGVRTEVSFETVARTEWRLDQLLERAEELDSPLQKALAGILEGHVLHGEELVARWQTRLRAYPDRLARAMIERHWRFFPLWYHADAMALRDAELWRLEVLVDAAFNLLGVLAGLNRLYFSRHELKRVRPLIERMERAPPHLAERLESLVRLEPRAAADELGRLVEEARALVAAELPDLDLELRFPTDARRRPWPVRA